MDGVNNWWILPLTHLCNIPNLMDFKLAVCGCNQSIISKGHGNESTYKDDSNIWNYTMQQALEKTTKNMIKILSYHHKDCHKKALTKMKLEIPKKSIPFSVVLLFIEIQSLRNLKFLRNPFHSNPDEGKIQNLHYGGKGRYRTYITLINIH